jgi:hypothetical protein
MNKTIYQSAWDILEKKFPYPKKTRKVRIVDYMKFKQEVLDESPTFVKEITSSLFSGDVYILKGAYTKEFMENLKVKTFLHFKDKPSKFYKMLEGCPDFHRKIDLKTGTAYSFNVCKHSFYFYPWNDDPLNLFKPIYERWRIIKKLMGLKPTAYENNTPKNGVIDRIQIVQYPSKIGYLEPHSDPYKYQKFFFSAFMSKKGVDFEGLGFYLLDQNDQIVVAEDLIDVGDIGIGFATIHHGVAPVNKKKEPNWEDVNDGRWFLSMYSNESDEVKNRHTGYSIKEEIKIRENLKPQLYPEI